MVFEKKINVKQNTVDLSNTHLKEILELCNPSEQFVLTEKYWLISWKPIPMQQIWKKFDISRERIRQILNKSLDKTRRLISHNKNLMSIIEKSHSILKKYWYIMSEKNLINTLKKETNTELSYNELLLILNSDYDLYYLHRNKRFEKVFFTEPLFEALIDDIHDTTYNILKKENKSIQQKDIISKLQLLFLQKFQRNNTIRAVLVEDKLYNQIFKLSRHIYSFNNKIWLEDNPEVNPKTIKLKIQYILSNKWEPMHYSEITNQIKKNFPSAKIKITTVHNELVKNSDFINVGMWTYWLKEWWYQWWNTLDTIKNILKKTWRPMNVNEITKEVLKERIIRESTILMVLQKNQNIFKRVWKWIYTLK